MVYRPVTYLREKPVWRLAFFVHGRLENMSYLTYNVPMSPQDKPLIWLRGEIKTPPLSMNARLEAGFLLRQLQRGEMLSMPHSRPMPSIGNRCH